MAEPSQSDLDRLRELAHAAAERAGAAFGYFVGHDFEVGPPTVRNGGDAGDEASEARRAPAGGWGAGVFFEIEGDIRGHVAVLLSTMSCENILRVLLGKQSESDRDEFEESALREVGNLLASHALSAIADRLGGRVLASIPILVLEKPAAALESLLGRNGREVGRLHVESELWDRQGEISSLLVLVPDPPDWTTR